MEKLAILFVLLCAPCVIHAQSCDSYSASLNGGWKEISTAPRDGRKVEMLETYGVAPWYDLFYWRKPGTKYKEILNIVDKDGHWSKKEETFEEYEGRWVKASDQNSGVTEDKCLFWRPWTAGDANKYVDPTNGAQNKTAYWCAAMHMSYDPKKDKCVETMRKLSIFCLLLCGCTKPQPKTHADVTGNCINPSDISGTDCANNATSIEVNPCSGPECGTLTPHPGIKKLSQYAKAHHRGWSIDILNSFLDGLPQYCAVIFYEKTPGLAEFAGCDKDEDRAATRAVDQAEAYRPPKTIASGGPQ
jgi:hypothetical protein